MRRPEDKLFAGLDLHSNNVMIGIVNQDGQRIEHRKLECDLGAILRYLDPFKTQLQSLAVESTFNWYWLVDDLRKVKYPIELANPAKIEQYRGLKHADDKDDAYFLAELQRLKILPTAHVYDPELRPRSGTTLSTFCLEERNVLTDRIRGWHKRIDISIESADVEFTLLIDAERREADGGTQKHRVDGWINSVILE